MTGVRWSRRYLALVTVALFAMGALMAWTRMTHGVTDPDMFWHVASGQWIVEHRAVPSTDVFSWYGREAGLPWTPHEWLYDVGVAGIYAITGYAGVFAVSAGLYGALSILLFFWLRKRTADDLRALTLALAAAAGSVLYATPRPHVVSYLLLLVLMLAIEHDRWWPAPLLMLFLANVHGAVWPVFFGLIVLYGLPKKPVHVALSGLALLVQPNGLAMLAYPLQSSPQSADLVEWTPTVLREEPLLIACALVLVIFVRWREVRWRDGLAAAAGAALSLMAMRHIVFFFLLTVPILAAYLPAPSPAPERLRRRMDAVLAAVLVLGCLTLVLLAAGRPLDVDRGYPVAAASYLEAQGIERYWNSWGDGGYLISRGMEPFVDGRADPFFSSSADGGRFIADYMDTTRIRSDIRPFLRRMRIEYLLVPRNTTLHVVLTQSSEFERAYADETHTVFRYRPATGAAATGSE